MTLEREQLGYTKLYALRDDSLGIKRIQDATLNWEVLRKLVNS